MSGCHQANTDGNEPFTTSARDLIPTVEEGQIASGAAGSDVIEQPIPFPHYTHAVENDINCQYCHSGARRSIHSGVPPTETCMGCHKMIKTDSEHIKKLTEYFNSGEPTPWKKVHDLPDYVAFSHKRHVKAGVDCTECHQEDIANQGKEISEGNYDGPVMVRDAAMTMQMGWCLDCHETHPSVDTNYKEQANLRRAELKDCWTCHK